MAKAFQVNIAAKMLHCSLWREWFTCFLANLEVSLQSAS